MKIKKVSIFFRLFIILTRAPDNICNKECPATIFANNRIARLNTRERKEMSSSTNKRGNNTTGTPCGINNFIKYTSPQLLNMKKITQKKMEKLRVNVAPNWAVTQKKAGNIPKIL